MGGAGDVSTLTVAADSARTMFQLCRCGSRLKCETAAAVALVRLRRNRAERMVVCATGLMRRVECVFVPINCHNSIDAVLIARVFCRSRFSRLSGEGKCE